MSKDKPSDFGTLRPTKGIRKPGAAKRAATGSDVTVEERVYPRQAEETSPRVYRKSGIRRPGEGIKRQNPVKQVPQNPRLTKKQKIEQQEREINKRKSIRKLKKKYSTPLFVIFLLFLIGVVFLASYISYTYLVDKYNNPIEISDIYLDPDTSVKFRINRGMGTKDIAQKLYDMDIIDNMTVYRFLSKFNGFDGQYKAGTYTLCKGLTDDEVMTLLAGEPETVKVTFPEGFSTLQIAQRLEANKVVSAEAFLSAIKDYDISSYGFYQYFPEKLSESRDYRLDGYLFPDTYKFDVLADVNEVIDKMLTRFDTVFTMGYYAKLDTLGVTLDQVITMASLIEKEAKLDSERATISGVFYNRLKSQETQMQYFQSCASIRYVYKKLYDIDLKTITKEHEAVDDMYNTYLYPGFMPGAICNPGLASIVAALNPETHDYYYFVLKDEAVGNHIFSRTFEEHQAASGNN